MNEFLTFYICFSIVFAPIILCLWYCDKTYSYYDPMPNHSEIFVMVIIGILLGTIILPLAFIRGVILIIQRIYKNRKGIK